MDPVSRDDSRRPRILGATAIASLALVASLVSSAYVLSRAYVVRAERETQKSRTLAVTGSARMRIASDLALWSIRVGGEARTLEESFARLAHSTEAVRRFLAERGFADDAVAIGPIRQEIHRAYDAKGHETRDIVSYELTRRIRVTAREPERVARAAGEVTELLERGADVQSSAPEYVYTRLADRKIEMVAKATADARERAERIARESGCALGPVKEARAGVFQITAPHSTEVSSGGVSDTSTIEKDMTAVIHLTFVVE